MRSPAPQEQTDAVSAISDSRITHHGAHQGLSSPPRANKPLLEEVAILAECIYLTQNGPRSRCSRS